LGLGVVAGICAFFYFKNRYFTPENANNNFSLSLNEVILQLQQLRISTLNLTNQFSNLNARQDLPSNPEIRNNGIDPNS